MIDPESFIGRKETLFPAEKPPTNPHRRLGVPPDIEQLTLAGLRIGAYDSESETPALHFRSPKATRFWYQSRALLFFFLIAGEAARAGEKA